MMTSADKGPYAVVVASEANVYIDTRGDLGGAMREFDDLDEARAFAESVAGDYHYGVEIVDLSTWEIVD
jgi:hypothetical protein